MDENPVVRPLIVSSVPLVLIIFEPYIVAPSLEGTKSQVDYSFNAIGIQPRHEIEVSEDTLFLDDVVFNMQTPNEEDAWSKWFKAKAEGTAYSVLEVADTGINAIINKIGSNKGVAANVK